MDIEHATEQTMRREEAAKRLHALADELQRQNEVSFMREGKQFRVKVPNEVTFSLEVELGESNEIEVEITW